MAVSFLYGYLLVHCLLKNFLSQIRIVVKKGRFINIIIIIILQIMYFFKEKKIINNRSTLFMYSNFANVWLVIGIKPIVRKCDLGLGEGLPSVGVFLRDPSPYLSEFRRNPRKTRLGRQAQPKIEPGTSRLPARAQTRSAFGMTFVNSIRK